MVMDLLWPSRPWQRVHLDFAGPFQGAMFLVAVDAYSKWPEVIVLSSTTVSKTLKPRLHVLIRIILKWIGMCINHVHTRNHEPD